jgi:hypothetical protein
VTNILGTNLVIAFLCLDHPPDPTKFGGLGWVRVLKRIKSLAPSAFFPQMLEEYQYAELMGWGHVMQTECVVP